MENKEQNITTEEATNNMFQPLELSQLFGECKLPDGYVQQIYDLGYQAGKKDALSTLLKVAKQKKKPKEKKPSLKHRLAQKWLNEEEKKKGEKEN